MKIKKLVDAAQIPKYQTNGSAGLDLHAISDGHLLPGEQVKVGTGIAVEVPYNYEAQIRPRSGLSLKGITCHLGTIDCDYRGEICVVLMNVGKQVFHWDVGDRIAQMVVSPVWHVPLEEVEELSETDRGAGGFGSTGNS